MKVQLMLLASLSLVFALPQRQREDRYYSDNSGKYVHNPHEGRYIPDNSGQYNPDFSGIYSHDGLGRYADDGTGRYAGQKDNYRDGKYGSGSGFGSGFGSGRFGSGSGFGSGNLIGANTVTSTKIAPKPAGFGSQTSSTNQVGIRSASARYNDEGKWKIIRQVGDVDGDGYHWEYLTENGINAEESGKLYNKGTDAEALRAKGFFTYTGPDNVVYHVAYTADENGFVPEGAHLPTPPPVPEAIQKSLAYQKSIGQL